MSCPVDEHTAVVWEADQARCVECGLTSEHTRALVTRGQEDQRRLDVEWLRNQARRVRAARELTSTIPASSLPLVPARILDTVAELPPAAPIGGLDDD